MPITGYHVFTSPVVDGTNTQLVRPSNWNSNHLFTANLSGSEVSGAFSNANNVSFALETNGFITASASYPAQTAFVFNNANGVTFGTNASTVTASVATNYAASDHSHGNPTLALTNLSGTTASNSNGLTLSLSAALGGGAGDGYNILAAGSQTAGTAASILFNNANGITFGMSNSSVITASHNGLTQQSTQPVAYSAANGSANFSTLSFANSNGVSFSTGTQGVYATVATNYQAPGAYLTTARASNDAIGLNTALTANGLSVTANSSGLSINVPAWLTTAANSTHSHGNPTLALTNLAGTTASASNGLTLSLSATAQSAQPVAASGSNGSFAFSTLSFGASNGLTFYTTNGSIVASYTDAGAGGGVSFSAGTVNSALNAVTFSNANGVTFGLGTGASTGVITASVNAGGGAATLSTYVPYYPASTGVQTIGAQGVTSASAFFWPISVVQPIVFNQIEQLMTASWASSSVSGRNTVTHQFGIYSINAGTALSLISSGSYSIAATGSTVSATISAPVSYGTAGGYTYTTFAASSTATAQSLFGTAGNRIMTFGFGNTMSLSEGLYVIGLHQRQSSSSANIGMNFALAGNIMGAAQSAGPMGFSTAAFSNTGNFRLPWGVATSTGSAGYGGSQLPSSVIITALAKTMTNMPMCTIISR